MQRSCLLSISTLALLCTPLAAQGGEGPAPCSQSPVPICYGDHAACSLATAAEIDIYRFQGTEGDVVRVSMAGTSGSCLDCRFEVLDSLGMPVFSNSCDTDCFSTNRCSVAAQAVLPSSGQFTILVSDAGQNNSGSYVLNLERLPPEVPYAFLEFGVPQTVNISHLTDHDFFAIRGTAGDLIRISIAGISSTCFGGSYRLLDPTGVAIESGYCSPDCFSTNKCTVISPNIPLPLTGTYSLMISDAGLNNTGTASVSVTCIVGTCEPNWVPLGTSYCMASPNSTGSPAALLAWGSLVADDQTLYLYCDDVPANENGIFFMSPNQVSIPFGDGTRCVGTPAHRFPILDSCNRGEFRMEADFGGLPNNQQFLPGSTWNFQCWFRDPAAMGAGFNLSDGVTLTFQ